jgi:LacI family transcriptional regulator
VIKPRYRVGIRLLDWTQGFSHRIFTGIVDFIRTGAQWELVYDAPTSYELLPTPVDADWVGHGIITFRHTAEEAERWRAKGIKVVNLSAEAPADCPPFPQVTMDNDAVALAAVGHLFQDLGLRDLAFWHDPDRKYSHERLDAFKHYSRHAGCRLHTVEVPACRHAPEIRAAEIERCAWPQLLRLPMPCGLFAKDDIAAHLALRLFVLTGLRCPKDIAVLGVNDDPIFCHIANPPLSSIRFPGRKIGYLAAELLHNLMNGQATDEVDRVKVAPGPLIERESTGKAEIADDLVAKAIHAIRAAPSDNTLSVADLCKLVGVSRESLRTRMQAVIGTTPKQEIDRERLSRLKLALTTKNATLEALAEEFNFHGAEELSRFFRRLTGINPGRYRSATRNVLSAGSI